VNLEVAGHGPIRMARPRAHCGGVDPCCHQAVPEGNDRRLDVAYILAEAAIRSAGIMVIFR
jgi:hypothetical protein